VLNGKPKVIKVNRPRAIAKKHSVIVPLGATEFRQASIAAKDAKQTVEAWIADMVYTSTQP
jgi:hypothetical protein